MEVDPGGFGAALAMGVAQGLVEPVNGGIAPTLRGVEEAERVGRLYPCSVCGGSTIPILWCASQDALVVLWVCLEHDDALRVQAV